MTEFPFLGGRSSLDLCNTGGEHGELFEHPGALAAWLAQAGLESVCGAVAESDVGRVIAVRDDLREAFVARDPGRIAELTDEWLRGTSWHLTVDRDRMQVRFCPESDNCRCAIAPVLLDALDLAREGLERVRVCASERCSMIYLDASRNHSRRWCSMERCGSRAKAHAYYERHRRRI